MKKILSLFLSILLVISMTDFGIPAGRVLAQENVKTQPAQPMAASLSVTGGIPGTDYTYENNVLTIKTSTPVTISGATSTDHIEVEKNVAANITLSDLTITSSDNHPFGMEGAAVKLTLLGTNTLTAPEKRAALYCPGGSSLTIEGTGTLNANGHQNGGGAGIGGESAVGNFWENTGICGKITINSGTINAICDTPNPSNNTYVQNTAAIGGWSGGPITINGGKVTAVGGVRSVGIGALGGSFHGIFITGGEVTAETKNGDPFSDFNVSGLAGESFGPAIGITSGRRYETALPNGELQYSNIIISGGIVKAKSSFGCAGIGGGRDGSGGIITITGDADVTAVGGEKAAGIGAGYVQNGYGITGDGGIITIDGNAKVHATGGINGAGIGGGCPRQSDVGSRVNQDGWSGTITIKGNADVTAYGGTDAPGIGSGASTVSNTSFSKGSKVEKIVLTGNAVIHAAGGSGSIADIGPGKLPVHAANPAPEDRFEEYICTIPGLDSMAPIPAKNSLTIDSDGNYIVNGTVTLNSDLEIPSGKQLIIKDSAVLNVPAGINITPPESIKTEGSGSLTEGGSAFGAYLLTVDNGTGGGTFLANTVHNISAVIPAGMEFVEWRLTSGVGTIMDKKSPDTVFIMGNGPAAVTAVFKDSNGNTPAVLHTLTVVGGNGSGSYPENTSINISAVVPSGKKFVEWDVKGNGTIGNTKKADTSFIMGNGDAIVTAVFKDVNNSGGSSSSGGNSSQDSSSDNADTNTDNSFHEPKGSGLKPTGVGTVKAKVSNNKISLTEKIIKTGIQKALKDGINKKTDKIKVEVSFSSKSKKLTVSLPYKSLKQLVNNKAELSLKNTGYSLTFDTQALQTIGNRLKKDCRIVISTAGLSKNKETEKLIGSRPVINFDIKYKNNKGKTVSYNEALSSGNITFFIPYKIKKDEYPGSLIAVSMDKSGRAMLLGQSAYDSNRNGVIFTANSPCVFGVGYKKPDTAYLDIQDHWAKDSIEFAAVHNLILNGKDNNFSPNAYATKADIVTALGRAGNIKTDKYKRSPYTDIKSDAVYSPYAQWAAEKGIVSPISSDKFGADEIITRQQLGVIIGDYFDKMGYAIPVIHEKQSFADYKQIYPAKDAAKIVKMQQAGIIAGKSDGCFKPNDKVTRAELCATLHRMVCIMIDENAGQGWQMNDSGQLIYYQDGIMTEKSSSKLTIN